MDTNQTVCSKFEEQVTNRPNAIAVAEDARMYSYESINNKAKSIGTTLEHLKIRKGQVVYVVLPPSANLVCSILAIFKSQAIYLPIDTGFSVKRLHEIFRDNNGSCVITDSNSIAWVRSQCERAGDYIPNIIELDEETIKVYHEGAFNERDDLTGDGCYIIYTSGSTGEGKAILGCHKGLTHFIDWETDEFAIDHNARISMLSQHTFDASLRDIFLPLCNGGTLCIPTKQERANPGLLLDWMERSQTTLIHCVPSLFRLLMTELCDSSNDTIRLPNLRHILMAGEPLYARDIIKWRKTVGERIELVNLYGTSETTMAKTFHRISSVPDDPGQIIHCGKAIAGAFVLIVSGSRLCRIGEVGHIYIKTPYQTRGYPYDLALHNATFVQNPLVNDYVDIVHKTGDLGKYQRDRSIEVLGRDDSQVKINGIRLELAEVDQAILSMAGVTQAISIARSRNDAHELICYYVGPGIRSEEIIAHLKDNLNEYALPHFVIALDEFPLNINGKIDRKKLPSPESLNESLDNRPRPATPTEIKLAGIWSEVLDRRNLSTEDKFFTIGGRSLKAMQIVSRIFKEMNVAISFSDVLADKSLGELAKIIDSLSHEGDTKISRIPAAEHYQLSHAQNRFWVLSEYDKDSVRYNMTDAWRLRGSLNIKAFYQAFTALVKRHEILRATFKIVEGEPRQSFLDHDSSLFKTDYVDLRKSEEREVIARQITNDEFKKPFNLEVGPLIRSKLLQLEDNHFVMLISVHHIIADGWSLQIILNDLVSLYNTYSTGVKNGLRDLEIHYKDFASWQNEFLSQESKIAPLRKYWIDHIGNIGRIAQLPPDKDSDSNFYNGDRVSTTLTSVLCERIETFASTHQATTFTTLLACYYSLIYYYTRSTPIIISSPVANRFLPELENQVGVYLNTLPFKIEIQSDNTFLDILSKVKTIVAGAFDHQAYPFNLLTGDLGISGALDANPMLKIMFDMIDFDAVKDETHMDNLTIEPYLAIYNSNKADLILFGKRVGTTLELHFGYDSAIYRRDRISRLMQRFELLIEKVIGDPMTSVADLQLNDETKMRPILKTAVSEKSN